MDWDELRHKWLAIRLSDGGHDGTLYDSKQDAVSHQLDEFRCAYVAMRNLMGGAKPRDMEIFLKWNRDAYDAGFRLPDPDDLVMTTAQYDRVNHQTPQLSRREEEAYLKTLGVNPRDVHLMLKALGR